MCLLVLFLRMRRGLFVQTAWDSRHLAVSHLDGVLHQIGATTASNNIVFTQHRIA